MARLEATAVDYAVDQGLIEIDDERLLVRPDSGYAFSGVRGLAAWHEGARGLGRSWELGQLFRRRGCRPSGGLEGSGSLGGDGVTFGRLGLLRCLALPQSVLIVM